MATKNDLIQELNFLSDKLSERSRVISAGVIAIWWATLVGDKAPPGMGAKALLGPLVAAALAILLDFLQYMVGYFQNANALNEIERKQLTKYYFHKDSLALQTRNSLFIVKQLAVVVAVFWLIVIFCQKLWP